MQYSFCATECLHVVSRKLTWKKISYYYYLHLWHLAVVIQHFQLLKDHSRVLIWLAAMTALNASRSNVSSPMWLNLTTYIHTIPDDLSAVTVWFVVTMLLCSIGALLLILLLLSLVYIKKYHTGTRFLIMHLMLLQLLLLGFVYPVVSIQSYLAVLDGISSRGTTTNAATRRLPIHCPTLMFLAVSIMDSELWASFFLSGNRLTAIVFPHHYHRLITKRALIVMVVLPWCIGLGVNVPLWFGVGVYYALGRPYTFCTTRATGPYAVAWATVGAYIPIGLTGLFYGLLLKRLLNRRNRAVRHALCVELERPHMAQPSLNNQVARKRQLSLTKMLLLSFVWYVICFFPGPVIITGFPELIARQYELSLWCSRTLTICGHVASPVSRREINC